MLSVFLDANIFFAAVRSSVGGSFFVVELAKARRLRVATATYALAEAERNIAEKIGEAALAAHRDNILAIQPMLPSLTRISPSLEAKLRIVLPDKDVPIVVGAFLSGARYLLTLDRKHLLRNEPLRSLRLPFTILDPGDFIRRHRAELL